MGQDVGNEAGVTQMKMDRDGVKEQKREKEGRRRCLLLNPLVRGDTSPGEEWRGRNGEDDTYYFKNQGRILQRKKIFSCTFHNKGAR